MLCLAAVLLLKPGESDRLTGQNGSKIFTVAWLMVKNLLHTQNVHLIFPLFYRIYDI